MKLLGKSRTILLLLLYSQILMHAMSSSQRTVSHFAESRVDRFVSRPFPDLAMERNGSTFRKQSRLIEKVALVGERTKRILSVRGSV